MAKMQITENSTMGQLATFRDIAGVRTQRMAFRSGVFYCYLSTPTHTAMGEGATEHEALAAAYQTLIAKNEAAVPL